MDGVRLKDEEEKEKRWEDEISRVDWASRLTLLEKGSRTRTKKRGAHPRRKALDENSLSASSPAHQTGPK